MKDVIDWGYFAIPLTILLGIYLDLEYIHAVIPSFFAVPLMRLGGFEISGKNRLILLALMFSIIGGFLSTITIFEIYVSDDFDNIYKIVISVSSFLFSYILNYWASKQ